MSKASSGTKVAKTSGGKRRLGRAKKALRKILMKIARWERNQEDPKKVPPKWKRHQNVHQRSRHNEWNTDGLKRHAELQTEIIERGRKVKVA